MDKRTAELYADLKEAGKNVRSTSWPELKTELVLMGPLLKMYYGENYREVYFGYAPGNYAEWYRCLAYVLYGYGNWSNNDRRRSGLKPLRKKRMTLY